MVTVGIPDVGIVWDEPNAHFLGSELVIEWLDKVSDRLIHGDWKALVDKQLLQTYWPPSTKESQSVLGTNDHPPLSRYLPTLTWFLFHGLLDDFSAYRLSSALLFSCVVSSLFITITKEFNFSSGLFSALSLVVMPRVFGHAHIAATDMPMMAFWWFCVIAFYKGLQFPKWKYGFALLLGFAWLVKFTGLLIPLGLILYSLFTKDLRVFKLLKSTFLISPLVLWLLNPTWWQNPINVFYENFLKLFITRSDFAPLPGFYFGQTYSFDLPWHQALVLTSITIPTGIFLLSLLGISLEVRSLLRPKLVSLFLWQLIWYYIVMALPFTPNHDGVRLFLPVFPFIACFAGIGFEKFTSNIYPVIISKIKIRLSTQGLNLGLGIVILFPCFINLAVIHPYYLEWYSGLINGVSGAHKAGFETTYWLDTLSKEVRRDLNLLPDNAKIDTYPNNEFYFKFLQNKGLLKKSFDFNPDKAEYIILFPRQGMFEDWVWNLYLKGKPIYEATLDGVPLFLIYQLENK
jgi:4-amino-4-deoxy-L-arabinose transferase-like glycosyltransferase